MAKPFDATTKQIVEVNPQDWLALLGLPRLPVEIVDADLAAVTTDADRLLRITQPPERLHHLEFEAGRDATYVPERTHRYNALTSYRHKLPVASTVFLLNERAGRVGEVTGHYTRDHPDIGEYISFHYRVIRVWEMPVRALLAGGVATLPLALLSNLSGMTPTNVAAAMSRRIVESAASEEKAEVLLSGAFILAGLRFTDTMVHSLFEGVRNMEESSTYQAILKRGLSEGISQGISQGISRGISQGRTEEARRMLVLACKGRLGEPSDATTAKLAAIDSVARLENIVTRLFAVETWDQLLTNA